MTTIRQYNKRESERLFRSCEDLSGKKKERRTGDLGLLVLTILSVEARSALFDAIDASRAERKRN